jgi:hypothetical protein
MGARLHAFLDRTIDAQGAVWRAAPAESEDTGGSEVFLLFSHSPVQAQEVLLASNPPVLAPAAGGAAQSVTPRRWPRRRRKRRAADLEQEGERSESESEVDESQLGAVAVSTGFVLGGFKGADAQCGDCYRQAVASAAEGHADACVTASSSEGE